MMLTTVVAEPTTDGDGTKRRRKRNRWGEAGENKAAGLMGLPTMIQANMTAEQLEAYTLHLRIEEISQKLRINDVVPAEADRCVSSPHLGANQIANSPTGRLHLHHNMTTLAVVSIHASFAIESDSKMSDTSWWKRP